MWLAEWKEHTLRQLNPGLEYPSATWASCLIVLILWLSAAVSTENTSGVELS